MTKNKRKEKPKNTLEGWSRVIREAGLQSREKEKKRKEYASVLIQEFRSLSLEDRLKALLTAHDTGSVNLNELMIELHIMVDLPYEI